MVIFMNKSLLISSKNLQFTWLRHRILKSHFQGKTAHRKTSAMKAVPD